MTSIIIDNSTWYRTLTPTLNIECQWSCQEQNIFVDVKGDMSDSVTNYNYVGNTKVSVSIKKKLMPTNAH